MPPPTQIPTVDITPYLAATTPTSALLAAQTLATALHAHGAVGLTGWDALVPPATLADAFAMARRMFALPMGKKLLAPHPDGFVPHRGYSPPGKEKAFSKSELASDDAGVRERERKVTDYKEHYEIGSEENEVHYNIWLPEEVLPGYRAYEVELFWYLHRVSTVFMDALLLGLGVDEEEAAGFRRIHGGHDSILRLLHYPPIDEDKVDREYLARCPAHQDLTTFTILFQDEAGGLEFEDTANKGTFMPATPEPGKLYLNTGDMFEIFSNGYYPSAMHRVSIPQKPQSATNGSVSSNGDSKKTPARQSIPFFIIPENNTQIHPAKSGKPAQQPAGKFSGRSWNEQAAFITKWQYEKDDKPEQAAQVAELEA